MLDEYLDLLDFTILIELQHYLYETQNIIIFYKIVASLYETQNIVMNNEENSKRKLKVLKNIRNIKKMGSQLVMPLSQRLK